MSHRFTRRLRSAALVLPAVLALALPAVRRAGGQLVTLANPDGIVIGLYRFDGSTSLVVDALQAWSLGIRFSDDKQSFTIDDAGDLTWDDTGEGIALQFRSDVYGDAFTGLARNGLITLEYDMDGDGRHDTMFGFARLGD